MVFPNHLDPTSNQAGGDGTSALHVAAAGCDGDQAGQDAVAQGANVILVRDDISSSADIHPSYLFHLSNLSSLYIWQFIRPSIHPSIQLAGNAFFINYIIYTHEMRMLKLFTSLHPNVLWVGETSRSCSQNGGANESADATSQVHNTWYDG